MLTRAPIGSDPTLSHKSWQLGLVVALPLLFITSYVLIDAFEDTQLPRESVQTTADVSDAIFGHYLMPFEALGLLLTATLIGAVVLARRE